MAGDEEGPTLESTSTWVVAVVCSVIVIISLIVERSLHSLEKCLKKIEKENELKSLHKALQKIKEALMVLGFISLLLEALQFRIAKICISEDWANNLLPCKKEETGSYTIHFQTFFNSFVPGTARRLLAESCESSNYCAVKGKVPLLSTTALHHIHKFIFSLALVHVILCAVTIFLGKAKVRQWKHWEISVVKEGCNAEEVLKMSTRVREHDLIQFRGIGKESALLGWLLFFKQFYWLLKTPADYMTLRRCLLITRCPGNIEYNFNEYVKHPRIPKPDFKKVVGISWYLWTIVVIFLLLNVYGWHAYFWIAFIPFILLLAVGTYLQHRMSQLACKAAENLEAAENCVAVQGEAMRQPSKDRHWIVLTLIHIILFHNSFELSFFFWIRGQYGFDSCIMGKMGYIIPRLIIVGFVQIVCSYSTLPLYTFVIEMESLLKGDIFNKNSTSRFQLAEAGQRVSAMEEGNA